MSTRAFTPYSAAAVAVMTCLALTSCAEEELLPESTPTTSANAETAGADTEETTSAAESSQSDETTSSSSSAASSTADAGESCGTRDGMSVVALEDGTTCDIAMDVLEQYDNNLSQAEGQALYWTAPNGWGCFARYTFPGEEDAPNSRKTSCSAEDPGGKPASEGSGGVAMVDPGDEHKVLIDVD